MPLTCSSHAPGLGVDLECRFRATAGEGCIGTLPGLAFEDAVIPDEADSVLCLEPATCDPDLLRRGIRRAGKVGHEALRRRARFHDPLGAEPATDASAKAVRSDSRILQGGQP